MNAGTMLGLLAGAGALNALGGGKDGKRFKNIVDMFDGGGAGQSGDQFEGGGLLSMLGNLFAKPIEAQDRVEQIAARAAARSAPVTPATTPRPQYRPANLNIPLDAFGGAGPNITGAAAERGMGLDPFGGYGAEYTTPSYANMPMGEVGRGVAPQMDVFQQATTQLANELGNAFYMMPQQEQLMRIQQRVDMMRGM